MTRPTLALVALTVFTPALAGAEPAQPPSPAIDIPSPERAKMAVCTDGKSHYIAVAPHEHDSLRLYYGDGKTLSEVRTDHGGGLSGNEFLEPRFPNPTYNPDFRGLDMRVFSAVEYDKEKSTCKLRCGERDAPLTIMPKDDAQKLLGAATFRKSPRIREAYALARDDRGVYYYVDRGSVPENRASFRVFVGKKGAMKLQKMKDVASDSEGEVYSTATGDLRLVTSRKEKPEWAWIQQGKKELRLVVLPIRDNLTLVYTTLGVYAGERFGTPCDDL